MEIITIGSVTSISYLYASVIDQSFGIMLYVTTAIIQVVTLVLVLDMQLWYWGNNGCACT